jgi:hypothetical protein
MKTTLTWIIIIAAAWLASTKTSQAEETPMLVNFGTGGGWYEPATGGQGFSFDIMPENNQLVAYWFTYPLEGGAREWYLAQGDISGDSADMIIYQTENGFFDEASNVLVNVVGTAVLEFQSCSAASWTYEFDRGGPRGSINLVRLGTTQYCEAFLAGANLEVVSHSNAWVNLGGEWRFEGCVQLDSTNSHGEERVYFTENTLTLEIDNYNSPNCQGAVRVQILDFEIQRVDKTTARLDGETVIANRFILTDLQSGQQVRQLWYVDDQGDEHLTTHGVMDSPEDSEGYPTELHSLFARRIDF